jgi:hypothetical protein
VEVTWRTPSPCRVCTRADTGERSSPYAYAVTFVSVAAVSLAAESNPAAEIRAVSLIFMALRRGHFHFHGYDRRAVHRQAADAARRLARRARLRDGNIVGVPGYVDAAFGIHRQMSAPNVKAPLLA